MPMFTIRFDFRNPAFAGTSMADRYAAALDMCEWADGLGFESVTLSEHHGCEDGYLPSALTMAAAIAARTSNLRLRVGAVVAALHDPVRLAEDAAVVDHLSRGRLDLVLVNGYVPSEFAMFGKDFGRRPRYVTDAVEVLRQAFTGEPFEHNGSTVRVTPKPFQPAGPPIWLGGSSEGAARRAARIADMFMPSTPEYWDYYRDELVKLGKPDPGPLPSGDVSYIHITHDPDATWAQIGPNAMHELNAYGAWAAEAGADTGYQKMDDLDMVRSFGIYKLLTPDQCVEHIKGLGYAPFILHPLMGGVTPEIGWENLRMFEHEVLPHLG